MTNRGRKGRPFWYVEDFQGLPDGQAVGKCMYTSRLRYEAEGYLRLLRDHEKTTIKVGDTVSLKPGVNHECPDGRDNNLSAKVVSFMGESYPGGVYLDRDLQGCRYWNVDSLIKQ